MPPTASWCFISFFFLFFFFFFLFIILFYFFNGIHLNKMLKNENKKAYETRGKMEHFFFFFFFPRIVGRVPSLVYHYLQPRYANLQIDFKFKKKNEQRWWFFISRNIAQFRLFHLLLFCFLFSFILRLYRDTSTHTHTTKKSLMKWWGTQLTSYIVPRTLRGQHKRRAKKEKKEKKRRSIGKNALLLVSPYVWSLSRLGNCQERKRKSLFFSWKTDNLHVFSRLLVIPCRSLNNGDRVRGPRWYWQAIKREERKGKK